MCHPKGSNEGGFLQLMGFKSSLAVSLVFVGGAVAWWAVSRRDKKQGETKESVLELLHRLKSAAQISFETIANAKESHRNASQSEKVMLILHSMAPVEALQRTFRDQYHIGEFEFDKAIAKFTSDPKVDAVNKSIVKIMQDIKVVSVALMTAS